MGEQFIDPHWLFDDEYAGVERDISSFEEVELIDEPQVEELGEPDEWGAQSAPDGAVVEEEVQGASLTADGILRGGVAILPDPPQTPIAQATGPLTRRLADVNASRPLRSAPLTLRLSESAPVTPDTVLTGAGQQQVNPRSGPRRRGCSLIAVLLILLCLSSVATLLWSGLWPSGLHSLGALGIASHTSPVGSVSTGDATGVSSRPTGATLGGGGPNAVTPEATTGTGHGPTPTSIARPTATADPYAQSATITFAAATQSFSSPSSLNACPSGCDLPAVVDAPSRSFSHSQHTSGGSAYWAVDILFTTGSLGQIGSVSPSGSVNGRTVTCQNAPFNVNIGGGQSAWFQCVPTIVPVPANAFGCSNCVGFNYSDPYGSYQDTSNEYVTQQDCVGTENSAQGQATSWEQSYTPSVGPQLVAESVWTDTISCSPAVSQHSTTVTGSAWGHVRAEGFNSSDAQTVALAQLDAQLPSGYIWKSSGTATSSMSCTPTWKAPASGSSTFTVSCVDNDVAIRAWTATSEQQLAASLVGLPVTQAIQVCSSTTHSNCQITLSGGAGQRMPMSVSAIHITVK